MGSPSTPKKVKLIAGLIASELEYFASSGAALVRRFGPIDFESGFMDFGATSYYNEELGFPLKRKFLSFARLVKPEASSRIKLATNRIEKRLSRHGKRLVNIDPGYLDLSKLVLLTTKDYSHRIYLSKGIYGEVTLYYKNNTFNPWEWTYPDYKTIVYIDIFNKIRGIYREQCLSNERA